MDQWNPSHDELQAILGAIDKIAIGTGTLLLDDRRALYVKTLCELQGMTFPRLMEGLRLTLLQIPRFPYLADIIEVMPAPTWRPRRSE